MDNWTAIVLAAEPGRRMRSQAPIALHSLAGRRMIEYAIKAAQEAGVGETVAVVPDDAFQDFAHTSARLVGSKAPLGPADSLTLAQSGIATPHVVVLHGDAPLLMSDSVARLMEHHLETRAV